MKDLKSKWGRDGRIRVALSSAEFARRLAQACRDDKLQHVLHGSRSLVMKKSAARERSRWLPERAHTRKLNLQLGGRKFCEDCEAHSRINCHAATAKAGRDRVSLAHTHIHAYPLQAMSSVNMFAASLRSDSQQSEGSCLLQTRDWLD